MESKGRRIQFSIRLDADTKAWLEILASLRGFSSLNDFIEYIASREINSIDETTKQQIISLRNKLAAERVEPRPFAAASGRRKAAS